MYSKSAPIALAASSPPFWTTGQKGSLPSPWVIMTYLSANAEVANNARAAIESISFFIISLILVS